MGVKGGWNLLNSVDSVSFVDWSAQKISTGAVQDLGPRIGRPSNKCKKAVKKTPDWLAADFKKLLVGFGFPFWEAPGEAEAELAKLSSLGHINAVMSEDFDTMVFGAQRVIRIKDKSDSKYLIEVYEASRFSRNDLVLITLLAGGDYDDGIQGCGIQTTAEITRTGIGKKLFDALEASEVNDYPAVTSAWHLDLRTMLEAKGAGRLSSRHRSLASRIPSDFPKALVLIQYIHPVTSWSNGLSNLPATPSLGQPDILKLAKLCKELFIWGHLMGIIQNFSHHVFPGLATRELLQDLCKRRGLIQANDSHLSPHAVISKVCAIRTNQRERSGSEIFVSLIIPHAILTQITSVLDITYDTDSRGMLTPFMKKHEVHAWLSRILVLHAQPNLLDDANQTGKPVKRRKSMKPHLKKIEHIENSIASSSTNIVTSHHVQAEHARTPSILEISSDESSEEMTEATPRKRQKHAASPKYRIEIHLKATGEVLELCTDDEGEI
ncbi:uncharacterized protein EV420DRAFT_1734522 [Desarmillaria tabescens]|uniref:XPG-I domain-containing protein n=1 Tax=Armillaria tabescens TaxID=1929756 RepID=A0AA39NB08_ARMTA|nr:uncharacterized protein EV420DRAFT_1734522 [Desarmillaria tabescens]KAK0462317.1 hypothetical protein EV420DRAFT_1734522 [Desarmillaria tabescens]